MPRKKQNGKRDAALRQEAAKHGEILLFPKETRNIDLEVLHDPTYELPSTDVGEQPEIESHIELLPSHANSADEGILGGPLASDTILNTQLEIDPGVEILDKEDKCEKKQNKLIKQKDRHENANILPEHLTKTARTTEWRISNRKTKKARAIQMQPSIASIFKVKPLKFKLTQLQDVSAEDELLTVDHNEACDMHTISNSPNDNITVVSSTAQSKSTNPSSSTPPTLEPETVSLNDVPAEAIVDEFDTTEDTCKSSQNAIEDCNDLDNISNVSDAKSNDTNLGVHELSDSEFIHMHNRLSRHVQQLKSEYRKEKSIHANGDVAWKMLDLKAISQYNDL
ncbi:hypothetical protein BDQ17DRAFT_1421843 [Cyathus striatus]|nr:hypothetical protein BDQ17DRAFT_1421843 [Cyathus striatus]